MWPLRPLGLVEQIALALALVGLAPVTIAFVLLFDANRDSLVDQLLRTHTVLVTVVSEKLERLLSELARVSKTSLAEPDLPVELLARRMSHELDRQAPQGAVAVALLEAGGQEILRAQVRGQGDAVAQLLEDQPPGGVRRGKASERGDGTWLRVELPAGERRAVWVLRFEPNLPIWLGLEAAGESARIFLLDEDGRSVVGDPGEFGLLLPEVAALARSGLLRGATRLGTRKGVPRVVAWSAIPSIDWKVVSTQPTSIAARALARLERRALLAATFALVLVFGMNLLAWRKLVQPVRNLLAVERRMRGLKAVPEEEEGLGALREAVALIERQERKRSALDQVFLGRYQVLELIGEGGMGTVFRGWDPRLERPVALKTVTLGEDVSIQTAERSRLLREAITAAQIQHPNVVAVYDAHEGDGYVFLALEYVHGIGLDDYLARKGPLSWQAAVPLGCEIARGLAAAHARGIVHRDIKPGNVLLGVTGAVKIADFGLADALGVAKLGAPQVFGTPGFIAPEQLLGQAATDSSDLFSLGVLLYRAVCGEYPFGGKDYREILRATVQHEPKPPRALVPELPGEFEELLLSLLEKDPRRRLGSAARVVEILERWSAREKLVWVADESRLQRDIDAEEVFPSAHLPSVRLPRPLP